MAMLHIVNKSPFERNAFESCLNHAVAGDSILMIEDAAVGAVSKTAWFRRFDGKQSNDPKLVINRFITAG